MNRKQWFVLGVGLILMSFYFSFLAGTQDCFEIQSAHYDIMEDLMNSTINSDSPDFNLVQNSQMTADAWVISCFDETTEQRNISSILFGLGIIFVIFGFLELKKRVIR